MVVTGGSSAVGAWFAAAASSKSWRTSVSRRTVTVAAWRRPSGAIAVTTQSRAVPSGSTGAVESRYRPVASVVVAPP